MTTRASDPRHGSQSASARPRLRSAALGLCALFAAGAGVALGCGWSGFENSVRFSLWTSERELLRLPPLPYRLSGKEAKSVEDDDAAAEREAAGAEALRRRAAEAISFNDLRRAAALLREITERMGDDESASSAFDQLDALKALDAGSDVWAVRAYLDARRAFDDRAEDVQRAVERVPKDQNLDDNVAYLRAAILYRGVRPERGTSADAPARGRAAAAFRDLVVKYPRSEKREAALYMSARAALAESRAYVGASAASEEACHGCRDEAWRAAREGFARLLREYPRGRLAGEARGWLAYLSWRVGDRAEALAEYYRMLADEDDAGANTEALKSLRLVRGRSGELDMEGVEELLEDEPRAALAYAYHDLYNYTLSYYFTVPDLDPSAAFTKCFDDCGTWERARAAAVEQRAERAGLARVARFAVRMIERHPRAQTGGGFIVRAAQANLELGEAAAAHALARRALAGGVAGTERAGALWVKGVAEYRRRDLGEARRTLARLAAEFPGGDIETGARRLLAVASEEAGDLDAALAEYLALSYDADAAYFMDVLMTPAQLAAFVERRPKHARRDELLYALGVRYLRAGRYDEARATLRRVRTTALESPDTYDSYYGYDREPTDPKYKIRHYFFDADTSYLDGGIAVERRESGVSAAWVLRDLQTAEDLARLSAAAERAGGAEAKAEALYQLASYLYEGSDLMFYNPAAWRGMRAELLASLDESRYRSPGEAEAVWRHAREHESVARALDLYLEVVRRYPDARAAPDALYTAILCHQRLAEFNGYWRGIYGGLGLHAGERTVTYADLRRAYPRYRLPQATAGWEPSTRTVNGRSAWPPPPAPKRLTGAERARLRLRRAEALAVQGWALAGEVGGGRVRRWSLALLCALAAAALWRATRRSRATLYELLRRASERRAPRLPVVARPASSYAAHEAHTPGARLRAAACGTSRALGEILLDARARAALALNLLTHGLLTGLLWALAWAIKN